MGAYAEKLRQFLELFGDIYKEIVAEHDKAVADEVIFHISRSRRGKRSSQAKRTATPRS